jgi:hypothetical protein
MLTPTSTLLSKMPIEMNIVGNSKYNIFIHNVLEIG